MIGKRVKIKGIDIVYLTVISKASFSTGMGGPSYIPNMYTCTYYDGKEFKQLVVHEDALDEIPGQTK